MKLIIFKNITALTLMFSGIMAALMIWIAYRPEIKDSLLALQNRLFG